MCTEKMEEYGMTDEDLSGEAQVNNQINFLQITASDQDDSTVRLSGAANVDIETMSGDVCIEINDNDDDLALKIGWYGEGWTVDNDFFIPEGVRHEKIGDILRIYWTLEDIQKVSWHVYH